MKPIPLPIILKLDLALNFIIQNRMNTGGRRGEIFFHTQILLVDIIMWEKCSRITIGEVLVTAIPIQYRLLQNTNGLIRFLIGLERPCVMAMM